MFVIALPRHRTTDNEELTVDPNTMSRRQQPPEQQSNRKLLNTNYKRIIPSAAL